MPTFLVPATRKVYDDLYSLTIGGRTLAQIFRDAGCIDPASPSCAACLGGPADTFARVNEPLLCVSTTNRNFPGRMGHKDAGIFLASPYTAAASAVTGHVVCVCMGVRLGVCVANPFPCFTVSFFLESIAHHRLK